MGLAALAYDLPLSPGAELVSLTSAGGGVGVKFTVTVPALALPAGRTWRTTVTLSATPADVMPPPVTYSFDGASFPSTTQTMRLHLPLDSAGQFNVAVVVHEQVAGVWRARRAATRTVTLPQADAVLSAGTRCKFGANVHVMIPQLRTAGSLSPMLDRIVGSSVTLLRCSAPWSYVAPTSAAWDAAAQGRLDAFANYLRAHGLKWVVALAALPATWGTAGGGPVGTGPASWADFDTYLDAFLTRYGDVVAVVENVNEPNGGTLLIGNNGWTWPMFQTSQQHIWNRVQAHNTANGRTIQVASPALAYADDAYVQTMLANGFGPYFDLLNFHPYGARFDKVGTSGADGAHNGVEADPLVGWSDEVGAQHDLAHGVALLDKVLADNGVTGKKYLIGEVGWSTSFTGPSKRQSTLDVTPTEQAARIRTVVRQAARMPSVYALLIYMLYDNTYTATGDVPFNIATWAHSFGMMSARGASVKPSLAAYLTETATPT